MQFSLATILLIGFALASPARPQFPFDDVHPVFRARCADCHSYQGNGGFNIAAGDIAVAHADSQLPSYFVPGQTKGFAALVRIQNGDMPLGAGCSGDPTLDAGIATCTTAADQALIQAWIQDGQRAPLPETGSPYCFGDGSGAPCPCANAGAPDGGCASSVSWDGGRLVGAGTASLAADTFTLRASRMPDSSALFFQGTQRTAGGAGQAFGDGLRCVSGALVRLATKLNSATASQYPEPADPAVSVRGAIPAPGELRHYQVWYRNAASYCRPATFNFTNGVSVTWGA